MSTKFDTFDRREKIRIVIFTIITLVVTVFAIAYVREWCGLFKEQPINTDGMDVNVDGANFNWFFMPLATGINGMIMWITAVSYVGFLFVIDLLVYGIFRVIAFRNTDFTKDTEYILAKRVLAVILIAGIVISVVITHFRFLLFIALLIIPMWLFAYLFYVLPLKLRIWRNNKENT